MCTNYYLINKIMPTVWKDFRKVITMGKHIAFYPFALDS